MYKKKSLLITFEGVEGSGKSYHSRKLFEKIKKRKIPSILTRDPGGLKNLEQIRKILLNGKKNKFANIWKWQEFPFNENILKTIKDFTEIASRINDQNKEFGFTNIKPKK